MDFMRYPGIPALNSLPQEERLDRFHKAHRWLMAHDKVYRRHTRRFWTWMIASLIGYGLTVAALAWSLTQGTLSREWFQGILSGLSAPLFIAVFWPALRYQRFKCTAVQRALKAEASNSGQE